MSALRLLLADFLHEMGVKELPHTHRTLSDHLLGTFDLLTSWNCHPSICIAGGLHSIYGTNIYGYSAISRNKRDRIRTRFGFTVERLVWLFCTLQRPGAIDTGITYDTFRGRLITVNKDELVALQIIEAANLIEQGEHLKKWPNIERQYRRITQDKKIR